MIQHSGGEFLLYDIEDGNALTAGLALVQEMQSPSPKFPPPFAKLRGEVKNDDPEFLERERDALWLYSYDPGENCFEAYRLSNCYRDSLHFNGVKRIANFMMRFFYLGPSQKTDYKKDQVRKEFLEGVQDSATLMQLWINDRIAFLIKNDRIVTPPIKVNKTRPQTSKL